MQYSIERLFHGFSGIMSRSFLMDEFSDAISACITDAGDGGIQVVSVTALPGKLSSTNLAVSPLIRAKLATVRLLR